MNVNTPPIFPANSPDLDRMTAAIGTTPRPIHAVACVYPSAAPAFISQPFAERKQLDMQQLRLYVHIPFCNYSCSFCMFARRIGTQEEEAERYVKALIRELEWVPEGTPLSQLFVGGGTPTAIAPDLLNDVLSAIFERTIQVDNQVHTVESSPESISDAHIAVLQKQGIGRVSMGVQSLDDQVLDNVQRRHTREKALEACELLVKGGFIVNIDLMYGLPGQTTSSFAKDLQAVADRGIHSVTLYDLRSGEKTAISKAVKDNERLELAQLVHWREFISKTTAELGFSQTRWHTFKRMDTRASGHQRAACSSSTGGGYQLGIGMSARSHLGYTIFRNNRSFKSYIERIERDQSPVEDIFPLAAADRKTQFVARSLGDGKPLERAAYEAAFGNPIDEDFGETLERLIRGGLIDDDKNQIVMSDIGKLVYDRVTTAFYPEHAIQWLKAH